jgi:hypothetical protein
MLPSFSNFEACQDAHLPIVLSCLIGYRAAVLIQIPRARYQKKYLPIHKSATPTRDLSSRDLSLISHLLSGNVPTSEHFPARRFLVLIHCTLSRRITTFRPDLRSHDSSHELKLLSRTKTFPYKVTSIPPYVARQMHIRLKLGLEMNLRCDVVASMAVLTESLIGRI